MKKILDHFSIAILDDDESLCRLPGRLLRAAGLNPVAYPFGAVNPIGNLDLTGGQQASGRECSRETVEQLLGDILLEEARKKVSIEQIQKTVAEHFDVRLADMISKRRTANIAFPRQVAMYLARRRSKASLYDIGEAFGSRDHGTVLHACKRSLCA